MTAIGEALRRERLRRNLDLETISRELKISSRFLEAMEQEKFERLPGGVFAKAFVRQYAHYLGLDEEEMSNEVQRQLAPPDSVPITDDIRPDGSPITIQKMEEWETVGDKGFRWSSSLPALALVVVVMMGCAGVYSWWQRTHRAGFANASARHAAPTTTAAAAPAPSPVQPAAQTPPPAPSTPEPAPPAASGTAPTQAQTQAPPQAQPPAKPDADSSPTADRTAGSADAPAAATPAAATASFNTAPNPNAAVRVEMTASEPVWMQVRGDGKVLFSGTVDANQTRTIDANSTVVLKIGNAGGVNISLNGKPIGPIGPKGQVRTIQLTSGGFEIVAAPKPPSAPLDDRL